MFSCGEDKTTTPTPTKKVQITSISPAFGKVGDTITIVSDNFGSSQGTSFTSINNSKATENVIWYDTLFKIKVPINSSSD